MNPKVEQGLALGAGKVIEPATITTVCYLDDKEEQIQTQGEFAFHSMGWLVLHRPGGAPPMLIQMSQVRRFHRDKVEATSPTILAG